MNVPKHYLWRGQGHSAPFQAALEQREHMALGLLLFIIGALFIGEHFSKWQAVKAEPEQQSGGDLRSSEVASASPSYVVAGFQVPGNVRYHLGHTWALGEGPNLVRVGIDDFAARLTGKVDRIVLPQRGRWLRQGQKICTFFREGKSVDMVSPIEGRVSDINEAAMLKPELVYNDPYGEGWLLKVESPEAKTNFRNLLGGRLACLWTQVSAQRLHHKLCPAAAGALAQRAITIDRLPIAMPDEEWASITKELFLS
jgi:glycine cleavage system H lipoate-binding protein